MRHVMRPAGGRADGGEGRGRHLRRALHGLQEAGGVPLDLTDRHHQSEAEAGDVAVVRLVV